MTDAVDTTIRDAAVAYAERGWSVIPLHGITADGACTCTEGERCNGPGKHPRVFNWQRRTSNRPAEVAGWWAYYGDTANVGIVAGPSGLVIVDIDGDDGMAAFGRLTGGEFGTPYVVKTRRGWHLYFAADAADGLRPYVGRDDMKGLDLRAGMSYIVAPPSRFNGGRYAWS